MRQHLANPPLPSNSRLRYFSSMPTYYDYMRLQNIVGRQCIHGEYISRTMQIQPQLSIALEECMMMGSISNQIYIGILMGCAGSNPPSDPKPKKDSNANSHPPLPPAEKAKEQKQQQPQPLAQHKPDKSLEPIGERDEELLNSDRPGWKEPQFITYPQIEGQPIETSPIHIIYSSDHDLKENDLSTIKKNLFKTRPMDNSVIHEVSQEYVDSHVHSQEGFQSGTLRNMQGQAEKIVEDHIKVSAGDKGEEIGSQEYGEEKEVLSFQMRVPQVEIFPVFIEP